MLSRCFLDFSVDVRASVIGLSQISSFSLLLEVPSSWTSSQLHPHWDPAVKSRMCPSYSKRVVKGD